jgi:hypothetical protein
MGVGESVWLRLGRGGDWTQMSRGKYEMSRGKYERVRSV